MHTKKIYWLFVFLLISFFTLIITPTQSYAKPEKIYIYKDTLFYNENQYIIQIIKVILRDQINLDDVFDFMLISEQIKWKKSNTVFGVTTRDLYFGDFKFRINNNESIYNDNLNLDPNDEDIITSFVSYPKINPSEIKMTNPPNYQSFLITFKRFGSLLTGEIEKRPTDTIPLYQRTAPLPLKGTWNNYVFEDAAKELANIYTNITPVVYPNPTSGVITMSINEPVKNYMLNNTEIRKIDVVKIVNMKGELVYFEKNVDLATPLKIDLQILPSGTYILIVNIDKLERNTSFILNK